MTGFGQAEVHDDGISLRVEIRSVNHRHLKIAFRTPEGYNALETLIEPLIRAHLRRGAVQVNVQVQQAVTTGGYVLNEVALIAYHQQLTELAGQLDESQAIPLVDLCQLPGVVRGADSAVDLEAIRPLVKRAVQRAVEQLQVMRQSEGEAMTREMASRVEQIGVHLSAIQQRAPEVLQAYQQRLIERLSQLLEPYGKVVEPADVVREVGIMADRMDIREEIVRLSSHLEQFNLLLDDEDAGGRKLEFLIQEMLRETNTIGAKANDAQIAQRVVAMKTEIERLREMVQNVE